MAIFNNYLLPKNQKMKNILIALTVLLAFNDTGISQAVTKPENNTKIIFPAKPTTSTKMFQIQKLISKTSDSKNIKTAELTTPVILKKDGTPDKRYKNINVTNQPAKKDSTPDMRYKINKKGK
jgi:hypothetical protein